MLSSKRNTLILIYLLISGWGLHAQEKQVIFEQYTYRDGLKSGIINDLLEDQDGLIWIASIDGLFRFDGYSFDEHAPIPEDSCSINSLIVSCLAQTTQGNLLVGTTRGLQHWNPINSCFEKLYPFESNATVGIRDIISVNNGYWFISSSEVFRSDHVKNTSIIKVDTPEEAGNLRNVLYIADKGNIVVGGANGIMIYDEEGEKFGFYALEKSKKIDEMYSLDNILYLATNEGIITFDLAKNKFFPSSWPTIIQNTEIKDLIFYHQHFWVATRGQGLFQLDSSNHEIIKRYKANVSNRASLTDMHIRKLIIDRNQNLWAGSFSGLNRTNTIHERHPIYQTDPGFNSRSNFVIKMATDQRGGIWYYSRSRGLFYSSKLGNPAKKMDFPLNEFWINKDLNFIYPVEENEVWILRGKEGIRRYDLDRQIWLPTIRDTFFENNRLYTAMDDPNDSNSCWLTSAEGLLKLNKTNFKHEIFYPQADLPELKNNLIYIGVEDSVTQKIWLGFESIFSAKLGYFDLKTKKFHLVNKIPGLNTARFRAMTLTNDGYLLVATPLGLIKLNRHNLEAKLCTTKDGLKENNVVHLQLDRQENLWVSSRDHIYQYNQNLELLSSTYLGLMEDFVQTCSGKLPDGTIIFGGKNGISEVSTKKPLLFDPPSIVITDMTIAQMNWSGPEPLEKASQLNLKYYNNSLQFTFSAPQYFNQKGIQYAYRLEGFEENWNYTKSDRRGNYTNLNPGQYNLQLKVMNENYNSPPPVRNLAITIAAPWWKTNLAYFLYIAFITGGIYSIYRFQLNRKLALQETEQLRELDSFKTKFFTNITHEFRTPLSLILGPAQRLKNRFTGSDQKEMNRIVEHGEHLQDMINQMLDLQRIREGKMPLYPEHFDLIQYSKLLFDAFESKAAEKNIKLHFNGGLEKLGVFMDKNILRHSLTNLISNAVKFTPTEGAIYLSLEKIAVTDPIGGKLNQGLSSESILIAVKDTGPGIDINDQERLFQRFEQLENSKRVGKGSGIGLSFAKELVHLLGGDLNVKSSLGTGAVFTISFPATIIAEPKTNAENPNVLIEKQTSELNAVDVDQNLAQILLVEDHDEMRLFIQECLTEHYSVIIAKNGQEGLTLAKEHIPDLIISDVMMPLMNGYELCAAIKAEISTSHIPCILLTAKDSESSRLYGLRQGAEDYLGKPFSEAELRIRIQNLLSLRKRIQANIMANNLATEDSSPQEQIEIRFVQNARAIIVQHLDDPGFGVAQMARAMHLSRTQLNRKLKALIGISPSSFLLNIRIEKAKTLLVDPSLNINEIAFQCGFSDASYFTKVFQKEMGETPSKFRTLGNER